MYEIDSLAQERMGLRFFDLGLLGCECEDCRNPHVIFSLEVGDRAAYYSIRCPRQIEGAEEIGRKHGRTAEEQIGVWAVNGLTHQIRDGQRERRAERLRRWIEAHPDSTMAEMVAAEAIPGADEQTCSDALGCLAHDCRAGHPEDGVAEVSPAPGEVIRWRIVGKTK